MALDQVRPQAEMKQIELHSDLSDSALVFGDPPRLEQVVSNLVWNAIKFTAPGGHVRIQLERRDRELVLSVSDTGVGISAAFLPYVFEWFRQADARARSQSGLGLGLGIVRHIVNLHGGSVRAESPGTGSARLHRHAAGVRAGDGLQAPRADATDASASLDCQQASRGPRAGGRG